MYGTNVKKYAAIYGYVNFTMVDVCVCVSIYVCVYLYETLHFKVHKYTEFEGSVHLK